MQKRGLVTAVISVSASVKERFSWCYGMLYFDPTVAVSGNLVGGLVRGLVGVMRCVSRMRLGGGLGTCSGFRAYVRIGQRSV
jgi:hypothetical protein